MVDDKETQALDAEKLLECEKKRSEEYLTRLKYMQADFENLKRRFDRETDQIKNHCNERLVTQLLDIVDELELAVKVGKCGESPQKNMLDGVEMTLKKLKKVLELEGVSCIDCSEGTVLDPSLHNAIFTEERDDVPDCAIIEQIRKGYTMKGRVIRPSIVKVAIKSSEKNQNNKPEEKIK